MQRHDWSMCIHLTHTHTRTHSCIQTHIHMQSHGWLLSSALVSAHTLSHTCVPTHIHMQSHGWLLFSAVVSTHTHMYTHIHAYICEVMTDFFSLYSYLNIPACNSELTTPLHSAAGKEVIHTDCIFEFVCIFTRTCIYICIYVCMYVCMYVYKCVCVCVCVEDVQNVCEANMQICPHCMYV
jgi:hypothetical protein